jgi:hypothetical protein
VLTILRHLWRGFETHLLTRPSLALVMATIVALSIASGERTYEGIHNFTNNRPLSVLITFGVQVMMVVLAWRLGDAYATPAQPEGFGQTKLPLLRRLLRGLGRAVSRNFFVRNFFLLTSFAMCVIICVFFSFDSFYQTISTDEQRKVIAENEAREVGRRINIVLAAELEKEQGRQSTALASGEDWQKYKAKIETIIGMPIAPTLVKEVSDRAARERKEDDLARNAVLEQIAQAQAEKNTMQVQLDARTNTRAQLVREREDLEAEHRTSVAGLRTYRTEVAAKEREIEQALTLRNNERTTGNLQRNKKGGLNRGAGPRYREYDSIYRAALEELGRIRQRMDPAAVENAIAANENRRRQIDRELENIDLDVKNFEVKLDAIPIPTLPARRVAGSPDAPVPELSRAAADAKELGDMLVQFESAPTGSGMQKLAQKCIGVLASLRALPEARAEAERIDYCSPPSGTYAALNNLLELGQRQVDLKEKCTSVTVANLPLARLLEHSRVCLQTARLSDEAIEGLEGKLGKLAREFDTKAHPFTKTIAAFERGDRLAYLAAIMAIALDGLVLMAGMWGARTSASHLTRTREETAGEIDAHAGLMMILETRPVATRPHGGWPEPAEAYKARLFVRHVRPRYDPDHPEIAGTISLADLDEIERDAVRSVLTIGPFAWPKDGDAASDIWLVSRRLLRYVTQIAANHDRFERVYRTETPARVAEAVRPVSAELPQESVELALEAPTAATYWTRAAAAANRPDGGTTGDSSGLSEDELVNVGFAANVEAVKTASNDNPEEPVSPAKPAPVESPSRAASA